jgi:hypothetical protein
MNKKLTTTDPWIAAISRALRRVSNRAMRLAKATRTPFRVNDCITDAHMPTRA